MIQITDLGEMIAVVNQIRNSEWIPDLNKATLINDVFEQYTQRDRPESFKKVAELLKTMSNGYRDNANIHGKRDMDTDSRPVDRLVISASVKGKSKSKTSDIEKPPERNMVSRPRGANPVISENSKGI